MSKESFIIIRVEKSLKEKLVKLAGGNRLLSKFIRGILEKKVEKPF